MLTADTGNKYTTILATRHIHIQREKGRQLKGGNYTQIISVYDSNIQKKGFLKKQFFMIDLQKKHKGN